MRPRITNRMCSRMLFFNGMFGTYCNWIFFQTKHCVFRVNGEGVQHKECSTRSLSEHIRHLTRDSLKEAGFFCFLVLKRKYQKTRGSKRKTPFMRFVLLMSFCIFFFATHLFISTGVFIILHGTLTEFRTHRFSAFNLRISSILYCIFINFFS